MKRKKADKLCSKCDQPGFRWHGERWLCIVHFRFDTMRFCAMGKGKVVPTYADLDKLAAEAVANDMKCDHCKAVMLWFGGTESRGSVVSLQHDRSGRIRFLCMTCNNRHGQCPGDLFYDIPKEHWYCARCEKILPLTDFYKGRAGSCCKACRKTLNKSMWAQFGKQWFANSQGRKRESTS